MEAVVRDENGLLHCVKGIHIRSFSGPHADYIQTRKNPNTKTFNAVLKDACVGQKFVFIGSILLFLMSVSWCFHWPLCWRLLHKNPIFTEKRENGTFSSFLYLTLSLDCSNLLLHHLSIFVLKCGSQGNWKYPLYLVIIPSPSFSIQLENGLILSYLPR